MNLIKFSVILSSLKTQKLLIADIPQTFFYFHTGTSERNL